MTRIVENVEVLRFNDTFGNLQKFYQVFIISQPSTYVNGALGMGTDYYVIANWSGGPEGRIKQDVKGQVQQIGHGVTHTSALAIAQRRVQEKLSKGYVLYTQYGSAANIPVPKKIADLLGPEPAATAAESEKAPAPTTVDLLRHAASSFTTDAAKVRSLLSRPDQVAEAWMVRSALEADLEELRRVLIQCEAAYELIGMQLMQSVATPVDSGRSSK